MNNNSKNLRNQVYKALVEMGLKYDPTEKCYSPTETPLSGNFLESNILDDVTFRAIGDCYAVTINTYGGISDATSDSYTVRSEEDLTKIKGFIEAALRGFEPPVMEGGIL